MLDATGLIQTPDQFRDALAHGKVREVSPDLIGIFAAPPSLYPVGIDKAWVGSSDNLYSLLALNRRYPSSGAGDDPSTVVVS